MKTGWRAAFKSQKEVDNYKQQLLKACFESGVHTIEQIDKGLAEALLKLLNDVDLSKQLGEKAREAVEENYSQKKIINEYIDLYYGLS